MSDILQATEGLLELYLYVCFQADNRANNQIAVTLTNNKTMVKKNAVKIFGEDRIRTVWDEELEKWFFSIVDVVAVLTDSVNPQTYWRVLKKRLKDEGNETVTNCNGLKMLAPDGRMRVTDVADKEQLLRIVQSIPSPKAEPFKIKGNHPLQEH